MKNITLIILVLGALSLSSCATILTGTKDKLLFNTNPPNAEIYVDGEKIGISGEDVYLKRQFKSNRNVVIKKEGYKDEQFKLEQKSNGAYWLNLAFLCTPCFIDILTGAALKPKYDTYTKNLTPLNK